MSDVDDFQPSPHAAGPDGVPPAPSGPAPARLTIGEFSRLSRLSLKALRIYDETGLLPPVWVDPHTGYRYYEAQQVETAQLIAALRRLDMPLTLIAETLADPTPWRLTQWWEREERLHEEKQRLVGYLQAIFAGQGLPEFEIRTRSVPEQKLVSVTGRLLQPEVGSFIESSLRRLRSFLEPFAMEPVGGAITIFHTMITPESEGIVEVALPIDGVVDPEGDVTVRIEPAHLEAYTTLTKGQTAGPDLLHAFDAVGQWFFTHRKTTQLGVRGVRFPDFDTLGEDEPACDIAVPYDA